MQIRIPQPVPAGLTVIETMRVEPGGAIRLWDFHLQRLRRDCVAVGFPLDEAVVMRELARLPQGQPLRARLTVAGDGAVDVTIQPLLPNPAEWRVGFSEIRLHSADPWLQVKTSHRPGFDAARHSMPDGLDEVILLNEAGEVCEGSITNIFLRQHNRLQTPALQCGVLPGVLRASLMHAAMAQEASLTPDDLRAGQVFCGNALRGLIPARIIG